MEHINQNNPEDTQILARLRDYMRFMKGYGQLAIDLSQYTKSSTRSVYRWLRAETIPSKAKIQLIKAWLDIQEQPISS